MIVDYLYKPLEFVCADLSKSSDGTKSIGRMRRVSKAWKQAVDYYVESSQVFRLSFNNRQIDKRCLKQEKALPRLIDLLFRQKNISTNGKDCPPLPPCKNEIETNLLSSITLIDQFGTDCKVRKINDSIDFIISQPHFDINEYSRLGFTPLHYACAYGDLQLVTFLIKNGAEIDQPSCTGTTALACAVQSCNAEMVENLLNNGANPNGVSKLAVPPLGWLGDVLEKEIKPDEVETKPQQVLAIVRMLLKKGANPCVLYEGENALIRKAVTHHFYLVKELVENWTFPINLKNYLAQTALFKFAHYQDLKNLLELGVNPHIKNNKGNTYFTFAISNKLKGVIRILLQHNPYLGENASEIFTTLAKTNDMEILDLVIKKNNSPIPADFYKTIFESGNDQIINHMIDTYSEMLTKRDETGNTLIHYAALYSRVELLEKLVYGRGLPYNLPGKDALSPLQQVITSNEPNLKTVKFFVDLGLNVKQEIKTLPSPHTISRKLELHLEIFSVASKTKQKDFISLLAEIDPEAAFNILKNLESSPFGLHQVVKIYCKISKAFALRLDFTEAINALKKAEQIINGVEIAFRDRCRLEIIKAYVHANPFNLFDISFDVYDRITPIIAQMDTLESKFEALTIFAKELISINPEKIYKTLVNCDYSNEHPLKHKILKAHMLCKLACDFPKQNKNLGVDLIKTAKRLIGEIYRSKSFQPGTYEEFFMISFCRALAEINKVNKALTIIQRIRNNPDKILALIAIAETGCANNEALFLQALQILVKIPHKELSLRDILRGFAPLVSSKSIQSVMDLTKDFRTQFVIAKAIYSNEPQMLKESLENLVKEVIKSFEIDNSKEKYILIYDIIKSLIPLNIEKALELAISSNNVEARISVARAFVPIDFDRAFSIANSIEMPYSRCKALHKTLDKKDK